MKLLKNAKLIVGVGMIFLGLSLILAWFVRVPTREINRAELDNSFGLKTSPLASYTDALRWRLPCSKGRTNGKKTEKIL
jgi:hypothetical protein